MKKLLKIVSITLSVSMLATSCGGGSAKSTDNPVASESVSTESTASSGPFDRETETLNIHFHANNKYTIADENGNILPVYALAGEKTNVTVLNAANPVAQNSSEEFQLQATKKFPADIYGGTSLKDSIFTYGQQGAFIPLNDLIDEHAPNIKKWLDENPKQKAAMTDYDGSIYMLNYVPDGVAARGYLIRTDWLEKLGLQSPTTVEELETALYAFKNDDPNGNGVNDEIPYFNDKYEEMIRLANLWGARVYGEDTYNERIVRDTKDNFYHAWTAPEFKEALKNMSRWYKDGIIDQEVFTRKANTARQTYWTKDNVGGMTHEWLASSTGYNYNEELKASYPDFKVEVILPPSYNGTPGFEEHKRATIKPDGWAISAACKNPVAAIEFMDWFYTEEGRRAINYGIEGETYDMVDGKPIFNEETLSQTGVNTYLQKNYGAQYPIGYAQIYDYEYQWTFPEGQAGVDLYTKNAAQIYDSAPQTPIMNFTPEERAEYDSYISNLNLYLDESVQAFITGKKDVDAEWDTYIQKCEELGSNKIVALYEQAYQRTK